MTIGIGRLLCWPIREGRPQSVSLLILLGSWEILGRLLDFAFLPAFSIVLQACWQMIASGEILNSLMASLLSLAGGYGLAAFLGLLLGSLMGRYRKIEYLMDVYLNAFLASPILIWVPILFVFFGVGRMSQVAVVFLYSFWLIVANTITGIRTVDGTLVEMARSFGANERQLFRKVILPGALPLIMAGLRIGMGRAVKGMIRRNVHSPDRVGRPDQDLWMDSSMRLRFMYRVTIAPLMWLKRSALMGMRRAIYNSEGGSQLQPGHSSTQSFVNRQWSEDTEWHRIKKGPLVMRVHRTIVAP